MAVLGTVKEIEFEIDRKNLLNSNVKYHYHDKAGRARRLRALPEKVAERIEDKFEHYKVVAYILPPTRRRMDPPNLYPTVKHLIDGLTDVGWWEDDDHTHLVELAFRYGGKSGVKGCYKVILRVEEIEYEEETDTNN